MSEAIGPHVPLRMDKCYQLTDASAQRTREAGVDENGIPREETICTFSEWAKFVDRDGNICDCTLSNSRVRSGAQEEQNYKQTQIRDLILTGWLPVEHCPHTDVFGWVRPGALVPLPAGETPCEGLHPNGCKHLVRIIEARRKKARAKFDAQQATAASMPIEQVNKLMESFGKEMATAAIGAVDARKNLKADRGEK